MSNFQTARHVGNCNIDQGTLVTLPRFPVIDDNFLNTPMTLSFNVLGVFLCISATCALAQDTEPRNSDVAQLGRELQQTRTELAESRREIQELRQSLEELRRQVQGESSNSPASASTSEPTTAAADQDVGFLAAKVSELHQDKVESASKYPVKLSGLILFNSYWNNGIVDTQDLPSMALPKFPGAPTPGTGATLRQTMLGIDANGPKVFGAQTSAGVEIDFGGGNPTTSYGVTAGLLRLRTANVSLDWTNTSLSFGQEALFFSPLSPTSYATVLEPAMSWSGNLWAWTPAIHVSHRFVLSDQSSLVLQGGVLDPLTEEVPVFQGRNATAGEATRAPAIAGRVAFDSKSEKYPFTVGFGGYRANQQYQTFPAVASWTLNGDIKAGFGKHAEISGEWYTGHAVGGLGGGIWESVVYPEPAGPHSAVHPLRSTGAWVQLKVRPTERYEINGAFGQDGNFGKDLRVFPFSFDAYGYPAMQKNRTDLVNFIYQPNSFLLFAVEYRHLFTAQANASGETGDHLNFAAGVHF